MAKTRVATGTAKDPDPKVEKAKQGIQRNANKLKSKTKVSKRSKS